MKLRALKKMNKDEIKILMPSVLSNHVTQCQLNHLNECTSNCFTLKDNDAHSQHANTNNDIRPQETNNNTNNHATTCQNSDAAVVKHNNKLSQHATKNSKINQSSNMLVVAHQLNRQ